MTALLGGADQKIALSLGERVARVPDALHRDASRVRGFFSPGETADTQFREILLGR